MKKIIFLLVIFSSTNQSFSQVENDSLLKEISRQIETINTKVKCFKCNIPRKRPVGIRKPEPQSCDSLLRYLIVDVNNIKLKLDSIQGIPSKGYGFNNIPDEQIRMINSRFNHIDSTLDAFKAETSEPFLWQLVKDAASDFIIEGLKTVASRLGSRFPKLKELLGEGIEKALGLISEDVSGKNFKEPANYFRTVTSAIKDLKEETHKLTFLRSRIEKIEAFNNTTATQTIKLNHNIDFLEYLIIGLIAVIGAITIIVISYIHQSTLRRYREKR